MIPHIGVKRKKIKGIINTKFRILGVMYWKWFKWRTPRVHVLETCSPVW
jgi:hypothetical protein